MHSDDYGRLMGKIHEEGLQVTEIRIEVNQEDEETHEKAVLTLADGEDEEVFISTSGDVVEYALTLRSIPSQKGTPQFRRIESMEAYYRDVEEIADVDGSKLQAALKKFPTGQANFDYDVDALLEEALRGSSRPHHTKFLPLKRDHHLIVALYTRMGKWLVESQESLLKSHSEAEAVHGVVQGALVPFRPSGTPMEDFQFYRDHCDIDLIKYARRIESQRQVANQTIRELVDQSPLDPNEAVPKVMNTYKVLLEILAPALNVIRIGVELWEGREPRKKEGLTKTIQILKESSNTENAFDCLDVQIRHAAAHASYILGGEKGEEVELWDYQKDSPEHLRTYSANELSRMLHTLDQVLFPIVLNSLCMSEIVMKLLVLRSTEYRFFLLGIGNTNPG